ncbi:MAG: hypothetical protein ABWY05_04010 [Noviherbaspirillum sp.]
MALQKSALAAHEFAVGNGYAIDAVNVDQAIYTGEPVFSTTHHLVQHLGQGSVAIHEKYRLPIAMKNLTENMPVRIRYRDGSAQLTSQTSASGHAQ